MGFGLLRRRDKYSPCDRGNEKSYERFEGTIRRISGLAYRELFSVRLAGLSAEDRERHLLGFVSWLLGIMKSCRWDIGDWWMVIWMGSEGRT